MKAKPYTKWTITAVILGGLWLAWNVTYPSGTWRYKMTVEVETPEGVKTGSAVREVSIQLTPKLTPETKPKIKLQGEAVVVDLGTRGLVFALIKGFKVGVDHGKLLPFYAFNFEGTPISRAGLRYFSNLHGEIAELKPDLHPFFVRFRNISDPKTVEYLIDLENCPSDHSGKKNFCQDGDHFEKAFGAGVKLKSVVIEMTKDSITQEVDKYLPWLKQLHGYLSGKHAKFTNEPYDSLDSGDFRSKGSE